LCERRSYIRAPYSSHHNYCVELAQAGRVVCWQHCCCTTTLSTFELAIGRWELEKVFRGANNTAGYGADCHEGLWLIWTVICLANGKDGFYPQGTDSAGNPVSQSGTGGPYATNTGAPKDPNSVTWPCKFLLQEPPNHLSSNSNLVSFSPFASFPASSPFDTFDLTKIKITPTKVQEVAIHP
jgi:hypothetical protein